MVSLEPSPPPPTIEDDGYVKAMPYFTDQVEDSTRVMPYRYHIGTAGSGKVFETTTEHEGLRDLHGLLAEFIGATAVEKPYGGFSLGEISDLRAEATDILQNMNFVGWPEYNEAVSGIGQYWRSFLDSDPRNQILVPTFITNLHNAMKSNKRSSSRKSDDWIREDVLLSDEHLSSDYEGRIVVDPEALTTDPEHTKIILLDDWSISGGQMRKAFEELKKRMDLMPYLEAGSVELNLLLAAKSQLEEGLVINDDTVLPIRAYFRAHDQSFGSSPHVSGLHSSVNYGFRDSIRPMQRATSTALSMPKSKLIRPSLLYVDSFYDDNMIGRVFANEGGTLVKTGNNGKVANTDMSTNSPSEHNHLDIPIEQLPVELLPGAITTFRDNHYFLSSMYPLKEGVITPDGVVVPSVEVGYQAEKFTDPELRARVLNSVDGYAAKRLANRFEADYPTAKRTDWDGVKVEFMRWYVLQKFERNPEIAHELTATQDVPLVEVNQWGDTFWGVSKVKGSEGQNTGENNLGRLLMEIRQLLRGDEVSIRDYETDLKRRMGELALSENASTGGADI